MEEEEEDELDSFNSKEDDPDETKDDLFQTTNSEINSDPSEMLSSKEEISNESSSPRLKPSSASDPGDFEAQPSVNPKPDLREFPRQTNKDTLSILKAKRIIRHNKTSEGPEVKKLKSDQVQ